MRQQVNLYLSIPKYVVVRLPARMILKICIGLLIFVLGFSIYGFLRNRVLAGELKEIEILRKSVAEKVKQLTKQYAEDPEMISLTKKLSIVKNDVTVKSHLLGILQHPGSLGFSRYLDILSQQAEPYVWLTKISITQAKDSSTITLVGKAYKLEYVTQLMQKLESNPVFANRNFNLSNVTRLEALALEKTDQLEKDQQVLGFTMTITEEGMRYE